jgi:translation initiation factor eIF-2B subunit alpha
MTSPDVDVLECFRKHSSNETSSSAVAAIQTLLDLIRNSQTGTLLGLREEITQAIKELTSLSNITTISVESGCELFLRFITLTSLDHPDFAECKRKLLERGAIYLEKVGISRRKIAVLGNPFIRDGTTILTHSKSRVVLQLLQEAAASHKRIKVFVTESAIDKSGWDMHKQLEESKIPSKVILDSTVGYIMEKIDIVVVGAEGVVESGGIINKVNWFVRMG